MSKPFPKKCKRCTIKFNHKRPNGDIDMATIRSEVDPEICQYCATISKDRDIKIMPIGRVPRMFNAVQFGKDVKSNRDKLALTQRAVAESANLSPTSIWLIEKARNKQPDASTVANLCDVLGLNYQEYFNV